MNTFNRLFLAGAVAAGFTVAANVRAAEKLLSPRAKDIEIRKISGVANDPDLIRVDTSGVLHSPKGRDLAAKPVVQSSAKDPDLAHPGVTVGVFLSPKAKELLPSRNAK